MIDYQEMQQDYRRSIYMNREQKKKSKNGKQNIIW